MRVRYGSTVMGPNLSYVVDLQVQVCTILSDISPHYMESLLRSIQELVATPIGEFTCNVCLSGQVGDQVP